MEEDNATLSQARAGDRSFKATGASASRVRFAGNEGAPAELLSEAHQLDQLFERDRRRHDLMLQQAVKIDIRAKDTQLKKLEFIYEECVLSYHDGEHRTGTSLASTCSPSSSWSAECSFRPC